MICIVGMTSVKYAAIIFNLLMWNNFRNNIKNETCLDKGQETLFNLQKIAIHQEMFGICVSCLRSFMIHKACICNMNGEYEFHPRER